jgi:hypothetical protein
VESRAELFDPTGVYFGEEIPSRGRHGHLQPKFDHEDHCERTPENSLICLSAVRTEMGSKIFQACRNPDINGAKIITGLSAVRTSGGVGPEACPNPDILPATHGQGLAVG